MTDLKACIQRRTPRRNFVASTTNEQVLELPGDNLHPDWPPQTSPYDQPL